MVPGVGLVEVVEIWWGDVICCLECWRCQEQAVLPLTRLIQSALLKRDLFITPALKSSRFVSDFDRNVS